MNQASPNSPSQADETISTGLGPTLRALREAQRLTPSEVSTRLKFSVSQLDALETEQWDKLPVGMPLRGFVKNYGRYLQADVDALLTMLDSQVGPVKTSFVNAGSPSSLAPTDLHAQAEPTRRPWGWLLIILVLLFVAGFYALERGWVPESWLVFDWLKTLTT